jgi:phosphoserine phosphatase
VGLAIPVSSEVRAWLRLRDQRRVQDATLRVIERIAEPKEQVRALLQLHQAAGGDVAAASASEAPAIELQNAS